MPEIEIDGRNVEITSAKKVLFPEAKITKGDLIDYYTRIAPAMLPHISDRPLTLHRYPSGLKREGFIQKEVSDHFPDWISRATMPKEDGETVYALVNDAASLVYLVNQNTITFHIWLSRADKPDRPDEVVFDLDPPDDNFDLVRFGAKKVRDLLEDELGLTAFLMTTGSKGLHVVVPLDRSSDFDETRSFAQKAAETLCERHSDRLTTKQRVDQRGNRLYLDTLRNSYAQTSVAPYSVRALPSAPVAAPLNWDELDERGMKPDRWDGRSMPERLEHMPDPWAKMWKRPCSLDKARKRLTKLSG